MTTAGISNSVFVFVLLVGLAIACETLLAGRQTDKTATDGGSDRGGPTDSSRQ